MRITPVLRRAFEILKLGIKSHRVGLLSWSLGCAGLAWWFGTFYQATISSSGGAAAFAAMAQPTADAMRPITGPAERLDTYGGYFTYHNLGYATLFLAIYAAIQGASAIRGDEEKGVADLWLAAGRPRWTLVRDRFLIFAIVLLVITLVAGLGIDLGAQAAGTPGWGPGFAATAEMSLGALAVFSVAMLVAQLVRSSRSAATITTFALAGLYIVNNAANVSPVLQWLRWLSPFAYIEQSRLLIPGRTVNWAATIFLIAAAVIFAALAAWAYSARDSEAPLFQLRRGKPARALFSVTTGRLRNRNLWLQGLWEQRVAIVGWMMLAGVLQWMYVAVGKDVIQMWSGSQLIRQFLAQAAPGTPTDQYISFTVVINAGILVAFVVTQAARWLGDINRGRIDMAVAHGISRSRTVLERAVTVVAGSALISGAGIGGLFAGAWTTGLEVNMSGAVRTFTALLLLSFAVGGVALLIVAWFRSGVAVALLTLLLAGSWVITLFGTLAKLPDWVLRTSVFDAFGSPYITSLRDSSVIYLAALAVVGCAAAAILTARRQSIS